MKLSDNIPDFQLLKFRSERWVDKPVTNFAPFIWDIHSLFQPFEYTDIANRETITCSLKEYWKMLTRAHQQQ